MRSDLLWCAIVARMKAPMNVSAARAQSGSGVESVIQADVDS